MKCELAQEKIALAAWGELPEDQRAQLEQHLAECATCSSEMEAVEALTKAMSLLPVEEPSANLMARTASSWKRLWTRFRERTGWCGSRKASRSAWHGCGLLRWPLRFS